MLVFRSANFRKENPTAQSDGLCYATATFGEWLHGLPQGWTALQLVQQAHLEVNRAGLAGAPRVSAGSPEPFVAPTKRRSLSLFTGCGALDYALPWCSPVAYCERDPDAAAVLRARMLDGCLTSSTPFAPPFAQGLSGVSADPQSAFIGQHKGLQFNSGRPSTK